MKQRHRFAVAVVLLVTSSSSTAEAQSGPDAPLQTLIESIQPAGYVATSQSPNVGLLGADALSAFNPDGVVYTPQDFVEHEIGFYGWHWTSTTEPADSRRVITIVGLSSASGAEPRQLVAAFASDRREAGKKEADLTIPDSSAFIGITDDGKQTSLDVAFIRNDRAIIVSAFGDDPQQLKADVATLTEQLALGAENLPSRVEHNSRGGTILLAAALTLVLVLVAGVGAFLRRSKRRPRSATGADVSRPQIS